MRRNNSFLNRETHTEGLFIFLALFFACNFLILPSVQAQPRSLWMGTQPAGSLNYILAGGISKVLSEHADLQIKVKSLAGPEEWLPLMGQEEVDIALIAAETANFAYNGKTPYDQASGGNGFRFMRAIAAGGPLVVTLVSAGDSGIKEIADIKGKKITYPYMVHWTNNPFVKGALASGGLTEKDIRKVPVGTYPQGVRTVSERKADVTVGSVGSGVLKELQAARGGINYIPIVTTPEGLAALKKEVPSVVVIYPESLGGKVACMGTRYILHTRADMDNETVYKLTKALYENLSELAPIHPNFKTWNQKELADPDGVSLPFHEGAIMYYKEKGLWTAEADRFQKSMMK